MPHGPSQQRTPRSLPGEWIFALDRWLCRRLGIYEYSRRADCLFRAELKRAGEAVLLCDGFTVRPGDLLLELHLWNEHIPPMGRGGPSVAWGRRTARMMDASLRELAQHLTESAHCRAVAALRVQMRLRTDRQVAQLATIFRRFGFEAVVPSAAERPGRLHLLGENILVALLILAANPVTLRAGLLRRNGTRLIISREAFLRRYGHARITALSACSTVAAAVEVGARSAPGASASRPRPHRQTLAARPGGSAAVKSRRPGYCAAADRAGAPPRVREAGGKTELPH